MEVMGSMRWLGGWERDPEEAGCRRRAVGMEESAEHIERVLEGEAGEAKVWVCSGEQGCQCRRRDYGVRAEPETL